MLTSLDVAQFLNLEHIGKAVQLNKPSNLSDPNSYVLKFAAKNSLAVRSKLNENVASFVIASSAFEAELVVPHVISANPRLDFCKVLCEFFPNLPSPGIEKTAKVSGTAIIGENVYIGHNSVIGTNVKIGSGTTILHNTIISEESEIGCNCFIKSNTVIGEKGFGFARDIDNVPVKFPHYGKVKIGDNVEIGALNTLVSGALQDTVIKDNVKTDDHVHIAHNCIIGENTLITACAEISGSVKIGKNCWIGPNASIIDHIEIGDNAFVGLGAVVTKSFPIYAKIVGNPARNIEKREL